MRAVEVHIEVPSKPARLGLWRRFRRAMLVLQRVLPAVPGIPKNACLQGWRNVRTTWRLGRELAGIAKQSQAERDANVPSGTATRAPVGPGLSCPPAGDSGSVALSVDDFARSEDITKRMMRDSKFIA